MVYLSTTDAGHAVQPPSFAPEEAAHKRPESTPEPYRCSGTNNSTHDRRQQPVVQQVSVSDYPAKQPSADQEPEKGGCRVGHPPPNSLVRTLGIHDDIVKVEFHRPPKVVRRNDGLYLFPRKLVHSGDMKEPNRKLWPRFDLQHLYLLSRNWCLCSREKSLPHIAERNCGQARHGRTTALLLNQFPYQFRIPLLMTVDRLLISQWAALPDCAQSEPLLGQHFRFSRVFA